MSERSTTTNKLKGPKPTEPRAIAYWPSDMRAELDQPIGFAPTCPTASTYPTAGRKVSA